MSRRKVIGLTTGVAVWIGCVAAGFCALQRYSAVAGESFTPRNPEEFFSAHRQPNRPLVVMAVHPRCPCTSASLAELGDFLARSRGGCDALLLQYHPENPDPDWSDDDALPTRLGGVRVGVLLDRGGKIAMTLGAATSGHVVFVDANGAVRFAGGITVARGHRGRSPAQDAMLEVLSGAQPNTVSAPVYGCALAPECSAPIRTSP
jgi:hypothetical protein